MIKSNEKKYATNGRCSIHTFEMCIPLMQDSMERYLKMLNTRFIYNAGRTYSENKEYRERLKKSYVSPVMLTRYRCYDNNDLFENGLSFFCLKEKVIAGDIYNGETVHRDIMFQVNPRILMGHKEFKYICIVPGNEVGMIVDRLVDLLLPYGCLENDIRTAVITRLDICSNITLDDQIQAKAYLHCLRKGGYYKGLYLNDKVFSRTAHRKVYRQNEVKFTGRNPKPRRIRQEISIYTKHDQMEGSNKPYDLDEVSTQMRCPWQRDRYGLNSACSGRR